MEDSDNAGNGSGSKSEPVSQVPSNALLIKFVCDQELERLKFIASVGSFLEDFADVENLSAKSLSKTTGNFSVGKSDPLTPIASIMEEMNRFATQNSGRNHAAIATNVSSNVCKTFPEYSKTSRKKVQVVFQRIAGIQDDLKKAKLVQAKNIENYLKLIKEAEMHIRIRDSPPEVLEKMNDAERESFDDKEKFVNMSFSKMISKMTVNDKRPSAERIPELIREIDSEERQLDANSKRLAFCRANLLVEIERSVVEVMSIEKSRVHVVIDGFMKLFAIFDQFNQKVGEGIDSLDLQLSALQCDACMQLPNDLKFSECIALQFIPADEWSDALEDIHSGVPHIAIKIEKFMEIFESTMLYLQRIFQLFNEVADVERYRHRSFRKLLEKYDSPQTSDLLLPSTSVEGVSKMNKFFVGELSELLPFRQLTASLIVLTRTMSEISMKSGDVAMDDICRQLEGIQKTVAQQRKDFKDGYISFVKSLDISYGQYAKARTKVNKTQALLKERYVTIKQAKILAGLETSGGGEEGRLSESGPAVIDGNLTSSANAAQRATSPPASQTQSNTSGTWTSTSVNGAVSTTGSNNSMLLPEVGVPVSSGSSEGNSLYRMASMKNKLENFGSSLRTATKLKQVVGLETAMDRIARIEAQILSLEKEEKEQTSALSKAKDDLSVLMRNSSMDLVNNLMVAKAGLGTELENVRLALLTFVDWGKDRRQMLGDGLLDLKARLDTCEKMDDKELFATEALNNPTNRFEIPDVEVFEATRSELVDEERKILNKNSIPGVLAQLPPSSSLVGDGSNTPGSPLRLSTVTENAEEDDSLRGSSNKNPQVHESEDAFNSVLAEADGDSGITFASPTHFAATVTSPATFPVMESQSNERLARFSTDPTDPPRDRAFSDLTPVTPARKHSDPDSIAPTTTTTTKVTPAPSMLPRQSSSTSTSSIVASNEMELRKFGLGNSDRVLESFSCAFYPKKGLLVHGRLFITQHFLAFSGWPETRILLPLSNVKKIEKTNTLMYIPNAISITCTVDNRAIAAADATQGEAAALNSNNPNSSNGSYSGPVDDEFFFGSFIEREQCYNLVRNLSEVEKRINEIREGSESADATASTTSTRLLEYGIQTHSNIFSWGNEDTSNAPATSSTSATPASKRLYNAAMGSGNSVTTPGRDLLTSPSTVAGVDEEKAVGNDASQPRSASKTELLVSDTKSTRAVVDISAATVSSTSTTTTSIATTGRGEGRISRTSSRQIRSKRRVSSLRVSPEALALQAPTVSVDGVLLKKMQSLLPDFSIIPLAKKSMSFSCHHIWQSIFKSSAAYVEYMQTQNDFDIVISEWESYPAGVVSEDITKTTFGWHRRCTNMHPRTTMLMFGPKNCSVKQDHYLCLLPASGSAPTTTSSLDYLRVYGGIMLAVYEFDGIPMGDVFKVLQYYVFSPTKVESMDPSKGTAIISNASVDVTTQVAVGLHLHFRKSSMFKSQIISGSTEESGMQVKSWIEGVEKKMTVDVVKYLKHEASLKAELEAKVSSEAQADESHSMEANGLTGDGFDIDDELDDDDEASVMPEVALVSRPSKQQEDLLENLLATQKQLMAQSVQSSLDQLIRGIKEEYSYQLLWRDWLIRGLLVVLVLTLLAVLYDHRQMHGRLAALEDILRQLHGKRS